MKSNFKLSRVAASVAVAITGLAVSQVALAGPGYVTAVGPQGTASSEFRKQTFFAYSPSGPRSAVPAEAAGLPNPSAIANDTGAVLRKFVDPLPLPRFAGTPGAAPTLSGDTAAEKYIPVAVSSKWRNPQVVLTEHDYFEIAVVEYAEKFHSDLRKATTLRGYVQLDHVATYGDGTSTLPGSKAVRLKYPGTDTYIQVNAVDANGKLTSGKVDAKFVDNPHFLGPVIAATKDTPTRLKVHNLLPVGRAEYTQLADTLNPETGTLTKNFVVTKRNGDLFLPVDRSILGAGVGPDGETEYTQNRASVHLHGGDTPWISDGTPHQWITPAGENDLSVTGSLAEAFLGQGSVLDASLLPNYIKGASTANVPDMNDPGDGAMTMYFPNGQSARFIWYHDHTFGSTRLNVYAGMASAYLISDPVEAALVNGGTIGTGQNQVTYTAENAPLPPAARTIPMVLQDRTFVPDDIALQDARWNTSAWGQPGDSWFPHVYETVQDPAQANNWNAVGRWHYGPWFWPVFPALYALPEGTYSPAGFDNTVTTTPEAWNDTPIINGVAYPTLEVDPATYRFRLLNAANDRMMTFNLFEAKTTAKLMDGNTVTTDVTEPGGSALIPSEIDMIPAAAVAAADACPAGDLRTSPILDAGGAPTGKFCIPETWPTDGRIGGVPAPEGAGPTIYQIASEGGWLPKVAVFEPTPINYVTDKGRIVVLNVDLGRSGLFLAPAERADIVVDFSKYPGKTFLVYNDSGAPVPAGDPRNDLFTGIGDQSDSGGAEDTKAGYGPNTRTMMRIKVRDTTPATQLDPVALNNAIKTAYFSDPDRRPIVAQDVYSGYDSTWAGMSPTEMYGDIYLGSLRNPVFTFTAGTPNTGIASILIKQDANGNVIGSGKGYMKAPLVNIPSPPTGATNPKQATGLATLKLDTVTVTNPGSGYTSAPLVTFVGGGGTGATGGAFLRADPASYLITNPGLYLTSVGGPKYTGLLQVSFSVAPAATPNTPAGVRATGYARVVDGALTEIVVTKPGSGYVATPLISVIAREVLANPDGSAVLNAQGNPTLALVSNVVASTVAKATIKGVVDSVILYATDHTTPAKTVATKGGGGYTDLNLLQINLRNGLPLDALGQPIGTPATATATGKVFDVTLTHPGSGYEGPVAVTFSPTGGETLATGLVAAEADVNLATAGAKESYLVKTKAIQELFDPTYGRLNATLGVEIPFTSALTQTTIPLGYVDENTEEFADGETQIWKITHNGVDSHPVHFHLLNVQVINRVGWDGFIQPAEPREMGWKETVMMSPLEDIIVAVRAKKPTLPGFGVPLSQRLLDPTQPEGSPFGFTQIDPVTGNPKVVTNRMQNFGWEYVWHCHILGHEENDFMRPIIFNANELMPSAPTLNTVSLTGNGGATVNFTDASSTEFKFSVRRATLDLTDAVVDPYTEVGTDLALSLKTNGSFESSNFADAGLVASKIYSYQVAAVGAAGEAASNAVKVSTYVVPAAVTGLLGVAISDVRTLLRWTNVQPATGFRIVRTDNVGGAQVTFTTDGSANEYFDTTDVVGGVTYTYAVTVINGDKTAASATTVSIVTPVALIAPEMLALNVTSAQVLVSWVDRSPNETSFTVERSTNGQAFVAITNPTSLTSTGTGDTITFQNTVNAGTFPVRAGNTYVYRVVARRVINGVSQTSAPSATATVAFVVPGVATVSTPAVSNVTRVGNNDQVVLNWTLPVPVQDAPPVASGRVQWSSSPQFDANLGAANFTGALNTFTVSVPRGSAGTPRPLQYYFRVRLTNLVGNGVNSVATGSVATK